MIFVNVLQKVSATGPRQCDVIFIFNETDAFIFTLMHP